jgi:single-strand DNA-binding protein
MEMKKYVSIVGNIGRDPEVKNTSKGEIVEFSVAVSEGVAKYNGEQYEVPTRWYRVTVWDDALRPLARTFTKGEKVAVKGTLRTREYQGKTYDEISAYTFANVGEWARKAPKTQPIAAAAPASDELPF